jgi:hypothetical protein
MKTKVCYYLVGLLFLLTTMGCRKKDDPKPDPPVLTPSLRAWVSPESVAYNGTVLLAWSSENIKVGSLLLNGSPLTTNNGNILSAPLPKDTVFIFTAIGINGQSLSKTLTVKVASPPVLTKADSVKMLLINKPWKLVDISSYTMDGKYIDSWTLTERDKVMIWYFYADGSRAIDETAYGGGVYKTAPNDFSISPDGTKIAFGGNKDYTKGFGIVVTEGTYKRIVPSIIENATTGEKTPIQVVETYKV